MDLFGDSNPSHILAQKRPVLRCTVWSEKNEPDKREDSESEIFYLRTMKKQEQINVYLTTTLTLHSWTKASRTESINLTKPIKDLAPTTGRHVVPR